MILSRKQRPIDLVPAALRQATDIDYAEALFGFVRTHQQLEALGADIPQGDKRRAYASHVSVTDGVLQDQGNIWLAGDVIPRILATPKPTAFQQYPDEKKKLDHYDSTPPESDETVIRGHKLYWHQGLGTDQELTLEQIQAAIKEPAHVDPGDTQHTRFKPLRPGNEYRDRLVLPAPTQFDDHYFAGKSRPQAPQAVAADHTSSEKERPGSDQSRSLTERFPIGRELRNLDQYTQSEQGVEVRFWDLDPAKIIGFLPKERIDRNLGPKISVVVTGQRREPNGRIVVELKLRPRRS